jgi:hypothetical protein
MTSVTASSSMNMDMISRLMLAGQVKLATASSGQTTRVTFNSSSALSLGSLAIPALTGSQIAIVYIELSIGSSTNGSVSTAAGQVNVTATGTGVSCSVNATFPNSTSVNIQKNSVVATTTTGSQTITFSGTIYNDGSTNGSFVSGTAQATIFIYTPPF